MIMVMRMRGSVVMIRMASMVLMMIMTMDLLMVMAVTHRPMCGTTGEIVDTLI